MNNEELLVLAAQGRLRFTDGGGGTFTYWIDNVQVTDAADIVGCAKVLSTQPEVSPG